MELSILKYLYSKNSNKNVYTWIKYCDTQRLLNAEITTVPAKVRITHDPELSFLTNDVIVQSMTCPT